MRNIDQSEKELKRGEKEGAIRLEGGLYIPWDLSSWIIPKRIKRRDKKKPFSFVFTTMVRQTSSGKAIRVFQC